MRVSVKRAMSYSNGHSSSCLPARKSAPLCKCRWSIIVHHPEFSTGQLPRGLPSGAPFLQAQRNRRSSPHPPPSGDLGGDGR